MAKNVRSKKELPRIQIKMGDVVPNNSGFHPRRRVQVVFNLEVTDGVVVGMDRDYKLVFSPRDGESEITDSVVCRCGGWFKTDVKELIERLGF